jgi:MFS family permease
VPWTVLVTAACALGGVTSFLPLALTEEGVAATALFVLSSTVVAGRWVAGRLSDRLGPGRVQVPSILACAAGVGGFAAAVAGVSPWLVSTAGAAVYGIGFGALQNDTLVVMFDRASGPGGSAWASAAWNMAYDAGTGVGAVAVGLLSGVLTVSGAFAVTATAVLLSAAPAWGCRRRPGQPAAGRAAVT